MLALSLTVLLAGSLGDVPRSATLLAQVESPPLLTAPVGTEQDFSTARLTYELNVLKRARPGIGGAITLLCAGAGGVLGGGLYLLLGIGTLGISLANPLVVVGLIVAAVGLPMTMVGVWLLVTRLEDRKYLDPEIKRLENELKARRLQGMRAENAWAETEGLALAW